MYGVNIYIYMCVVCKGRSSKSLIQGYGGGGEELFFLCMSLYR